jgi:hypothetical protein
MEARVMRRNLEKRKLSICEFKAFVAGNAGGRKWFAVEL